MKEFEQDSLKVRIYPNRTEMGRAAAADFAAIVKMLLAGKERVRVIFAAAPSQNDFLKAVAEDPTIDFSRIDAFHMDEYVGLDHTAPQALGQFLRERLFDRVSFHSVSYIDGESADTAAACAEYANLLNEAPIDIVCMGIGENGHIAFNDPEFAEFDEPDDVKLVDLDAICRMQQVHDGCFQNLSEVPDQALTLTVPRLMRAEYHLCIVPAPNKAESVKRMLRGPVAEEFPCTILRRQPNATMYLDQDSSLLL